MRKLITTIALIGFLAACQTETTGEAGVGYGMSKQAVIEHLSKTDKIINSDGEEIVSEGPFAPTGGRAQKTFVFQDGKLVTVKYKIL
jgi:hypothetical protein